MEATTKFCKACATEKPVTDFYLATPTNPRLKPRYLPRCKLCESAYQRQRYHARRAQAAAMKTAMREIEAGPLVTPSQPERSVH